VARIVAFFRLYLLRHPQRRDQSACDSSARDSTLTFSSRPWGSFIRRQAKLRVRMALSGTACHSWDLEWLPTQHPSVLAKFLRRGLPGLLADAKSEHASLPGEVTSTVQELRWSTPALGGPCSSWCWPSETQESSDPLFGQRVFSLRFGLARLRSQPIAFSGARLFSRHLDVRFVFFLRD